MVVAVPSVVNGVNTLNEMLNPHNLVPGPGDNAIAGRVKGTIGRIGRNGVSFGMSGSNVIRASVNGVSFGSSRVHSGTGRFVSALLGLGPSTTGNACVGDVCLSDAVDTNVGVSPGSIRRGWLGLLSGRGKEWELGCESAS